MNYPVGDFDESAERAARSAASAFGREGLAALAGGLLLIPANLHYRVRLETLAMCAALEQGSGRRAPTRSSTRALLNESYSAWVGHLDDPCETLATEAFTFNGGNHVFVGPEPERLYVLRTLATVIAHSESVPEAFARAALGAIQGVSAISALVASRAGLSRNMDVPEHRSEVFVPPETDLKRLMNAVRITAAEVAEISTRTTVRRVDVDALCSRPPPGASAHPEVACEHVAAYPLIRSGDDLIVSAPHCLAEALVLRLMHLAVEFGVETQLSQAFHACLVMQVGRDLERLGLHQSSDRMPARSRLENSLATHLLYQCDRDKLLHIAVVSDVLPRAKALAAPTPALVELVNELAAMRGLIPEMIKTADSPVEEWLSVAIGQTLQRTAIAFPSPENDEPGLLSFSVANIEAIVTAGPDRSPLLLWRYHAALRDLERRARTMSWSPLDMFAAWSERGFSFPNETDGFYVGSEMAVALRERAVTTYDWHAIPSSVPGRVIEVGFADGPEQPVFRPRGTFGNRVELAVECGRLVVWIVSQKIEEGRLTDWFDVGRMMAFWVAEFSAFMPSDFASPERRASVVVVDLELLAREVTAPSDLGYSISTVVEGIRVTVHPSFVEGYDDSNARERVFAIGLVSAVLNAIGMVRETAEAKVALAAATVAPDGVKRMMHRIDTSLLHEFIGTDALAPPRFPHAGDLADLRRVLLTKFAVVGTLRDADASSWLNKSVGHMYQELVRRIARFNAQDLLRRLLSNNEALIREDAIQDLTLASQLACYRPGDAAHRRLLESGPRHAAASLAGRFLIELVAATPPEGQKLISDLELDTVLALALEITVLGMASDISKHELAAVEVAVEDGDLAVRRGTYESASRGSLFAHTRQQLRREASRRRVRGNGTARDSTEREEFVARVEEATRTEFGVTFTTLVSVLGEAVSICMEQEQAVVTVPRDEFVRGAAKQLGVAEADIEVAVDALVLRSRDDFTRPPESFTPSDIWPWRFNRGLSYVRRPLVETDTDGRRELWFSPGHVSRASKNLVHLISTGRLKARTQPLQQAMGDFTAESSQAFNDDVAEALQSRGFLVRARAAKFGKKRIVDEKGQSLGDVDVLCVDVAARRILAVECKDFQMARMPHEVRADLEALFISTASKRCAQEKHIGRVDWVRKNAALVLSSMGVDDQGVQWTVQGAFAFSVSLISPLLGRAKLPVMTLDELRDPEWPLPGA